MSTEVLSWFAAARGKAGKVLVQLWSGDPCKMHVNVLEDCILSGMNVHHKVSHPWLDVATHLFGWWSWNSCTSAARTSSRSKHHRAMRCPICSRALSFGLSGLAKLRGLGPTFVKQKADGTPDESTALRLVILCYGFRWIPTIWPDPLPPDAVALCHPCFECLGEVHY